MAAVVAAFTAVEEAAFTRGVAASAAARVAAHFRRRGWEAAAIRAPRQGLLRAQAVDPMRDPAAMHINRTAPLLTFLRAEGTPTPRLAALLTASGNRLAALQRLEEAEHPRPRVDPQVPRTEDGKASEEIVRLAQDPSEVSPAREIKFGKTRRPLAMWCHLPALFRVFEVRSEILWPARPAFVRTDLLPLSRYFRLGLHWEMV